jgi:hypothetical protein
VRKPILALLLVSGAALADAGPTTTDAVRVETPLGPALVTPQVPVGHYGERYAEGAYWLPGVAEGTSLVRKVIKAARLRRDSGTRIALRSYLAGEHRVYVTQEPPSPGVFWLAAGEGRAWMAGVARPDAEQRAALEAAAAAEASHAPVGAAGEPVGDVPSNSN